MEPAGGLLDSHVLSFPAVEIPLLAGPTAVGKTHVSLHLASLLGGHIVSCDSRQLYAELEIGTAKPSREEQDTVPHHLVGEASVSDPWSAGQFARAAEGRIQAVLDAGHVPIVVGGSTLYIRALTEGLAEIPPTEPGLRHRLNERLQSVGSRKLYQTLLHVDPAFAATLDETKSQRIIRGLEVYASTGRPLSSYFAEIQPPAFSYRTYVLNRDRESLYRRIDTRVDMMIEAGLLAEVRDLIAAGFDPDRNPLRTIGYSELASFLQGDVALDEAIRLIKRNSRRYAKRQLTWFRGQLDAHWITLDEDSDPQSVARFIRDDLQRILVDGTP